MDALRTVKKKTKEATVLKPALHNTTHLNHVLKSEWYVQEQFHALADIDDRTFVKLMLAVGLGRLLVDVVFVQRLAGEYSEKRRARAKLRRTPPLAVPSTSRRNRCCAHGSSSTEQNGSHFPIWSYFHLKT